MNFTSNRCSEYRNVISFRVGFINTLRTGDADLRLYITTVQDG